MAKSKDPGPVYVKKFGNSENIVFYCAKMEMGKKYVVKWRGDTYSLRKTDKKIEILKHQSS